MTPEEEIKGLKAICQAWAADCKHYCDALKSVRALAEPHINDEGMFGAEVHAMCDNALKHDEQCVVCGDYHEGEVPRSCETGDGV